MSNYNIGDKFEIEIDSDFVDENDNKLYRIKGFNSLVFDKRGLDKLKKIKPEVAPIKTVKASELPVDTVVLCGRWRDKRYFATFFNGEMYAFNNGECSLQTATITNWDCMTLEDGTVVLPE